MQSLQAGQKTLQTTVERQEKQLTALQNTVETQEKAITELRVGQQALDLKVEAVNASLMRLHDESNRDHKEIMEHPLNNAEISEQDHKALEKRVDWIEKRLNLPPLK